MPMPMACCCGLRIATLVTILLVKVAPSLGAMSPQLGGAHFKITAVQEPGFLDVNDGESGDVEFSGYLIDIINALALPERGNFTFDLLPPSGLGSACSPRLSEVSAIQPYDDRYRTQYVCGKSDVIDGGDPNSNSSRVYQTDMYLGLFYVTPGRQLLNQFTIPFLPPTSGTLAMFGTATGIANFGDLAKQQNEGVQKEACGPAGTALLSFVETANLGLTMKGIYGGEDEIYESFKTGECEIYGVDGPIAAQLVLRFSHRNMCLANGMVRIDDGRSKFVELTIFLANRSHRLSHYAIDIRDDISVDVTETLSYWMNVLMSCSPADPLGPCPVGNLASFYNGKGGTGMECGYVQYPEEANISPVIGFSFAAVLLLISGCVLFYWVRLRNKQTIAAQAQAIADSQVSKEREVNDLIRSEVNNPLSNAKKALTALRQKTKNSST